MTTQDRILQTATQLFNQYGTAKVSTNQIAKEAGISPGNLYYHYENKAHIIREVYEQMISEWEAPYERIEGQPLSFEAIKLFIADNFHMLWRYRFFYRETVALLNADPVLAARNVAVSNLRFQRQRALLQKAADSGILRFPEPGVRLEDLLTIIWIIANHYLTHLESMGQKVEHNDFETGAGLALVVLRPYLFNMSSGQGKL